MYQDFTYKTPGTFISPPGKNGEDVGKTIMVFHHVLLPCLRAFVGGTLSKAKKFHKRTLSHKEF